MKQIACGYWQIFRQLRLLISSSVTSVVNNMSDIHFEQNLKGSPKAEQFSLCHNPLQPLPLGDIRCGEGWLYEQLKLVAGGITGRLPEYGPYFRKENNGFLHPEVDRGWEEIPYWLRGFFPLAVLLGDEKLLKTANAYIEAIFRSAQKDGWFGPAYLKTAAVTDDEKPIPDLFPNMLLTDTLILYHSYTKDPRVLELLGRYFHFCLSLSDPQFLPPIRKGKLRWQKIRAGGMLEQLYWYYRVTGDKDALTLANRVYRGIAKSKSGFAATHAVDFSQRFAYDGIYSQQSGEKAHFEKSEYEYDKYALIWGQMPRGIFASDEKIRIGATDPRQAFEPCGMVELAKNFYSLGRISGLTKYADRAEDVMLNHFAASFTPDYKQVHYLTSANGPVLSNYTYASTNNGSHSHDRSYQIMTPNNRCCGHNTGMGWPWYTMNLWQKTAEGGLAVFLYAPCQVDTTVNGKRIRWTVRTDYPFKDSVCMEAGFDGELSMGFRIPAWCVNCSCTINGKAVWSGTQSGGWLCIHREWKQGDVVGLTFSMELSLTKWRNNGSVSVDRGPLTYSVRIKEQYRVVEDAFAYNHPKPHLWENYEILPASPWNYGLVLENGELGGSVSVYSVAEGLAKQPFSEEAAPVVLQARVKRIPQWQTQDSCAAELQQSPVYSEEPEELIEMIPMGCARLRMTCLPVLTDDPYAPRWEEAPAHIPCEQRPASFPLEYDFLEDHKEVSPTEQEAPWKPEDER